MLCIVSQQSHLTLKDSLHQLHGQEPINGAVLQSDSSYIILKPFSNDSHVIAQLQFIELQYSDAREYG